MAHAASASEPSNEDISMSDSARPQSLEEALGGAGLRGWKAHRFGIIGHDDNCEVCAAMGRHILESVNNGEGAAILRAAQEMVEASNTRLLFPVMSVEQWAASFSPVIHCPPGTFACTVANWLTYYANVLPVDITLSELSCRPANTQQGTTDRDLRDEHRRREHRVSLLREIMRLINQFQSLLVPGLHAPISDNTPQAVWTALPRRLRGDGDAHYPRRVVYPVLRKIKTKIGEIVCALPSRPLSPFELIDSDHSLILTRGAGGHTHFAGSLWNYVPRIPCTEKELRYCTWECEFKTEEQQLKLYIEACAIPWLARSPIQRSFVHQQTTALIESEGGNDMMGDISEDANISDLDEQSLMWSTDMPASIPGSVVDNVWRYDEIAVAVWAFMLWTFPVDTKRALAALKHGRDRAVHGRVVPPYNPTEFTGDTTRYVHNDVHDHIVYCCGIEIEDLKHFYALARDWDDVKVDSRHLQEHFKWSALKRSGEAGGWGVNALVMSPDDPPITTIDAKQVLTMHDRRHQEQARAASSQQRAGSAQASSPHKAASTQVPAKRAPSEQSGSSSSAHTSPSKPPVTKRFKNYHPRAE